MKRVLVYTVSGLLLAGAGFGALSSAGEAAPDTGQGVLENLFQTFPGFPFSLDYTAIEFDLTQFAGSTVRLRVGIAANQGVLNFALDEVTCIAEIVSIPTLGEWGMIAMAGVLGLVGLIFAARRRTLAA